MLGLGDESTLGLPEERVPVKDARPEELVEGVIYPITR